MAALATRAYVAAGGDYYLCPLPASQSNISSLVSYLEPVWSGKQDLTSIKYTYANGETEEIAVGYELSVRRTTKFEGVEVTWSERQLVVRSLSAATAGSKSLQTRLAKAQAALAQLGQPRRGKKRLTQLDEWQQAATDICQRYRVQGLLQLDYQVTTTPASLKTLSRPTCPSSHRTFWYSFLSNWMKQLWSCRKECWAGGFM